MNDSIQVDLNRLILSSIDANTYIILYCIYVGDSNSLIKYLNSKGKPNEDYFKNLINENLLIQIDQEKGFKFDNLKIGDKFISEFSLNKDKINIDKDIEKLFSEVCEFYPSVVKQDIKIRRLHTEKANCKNLYKKAISINGIIDYSLHDKIISSIKREVEERKRSQSLFFMTELIRYIRNKRWETYFGEESIQQNSFKKVI